MSRVKVAPTVWMDEGPSVALGTTRFRIGGSFVVAHEPPPPAPRDRREQGSAYYQANKERVLEAQRQRRARAR